jgi:hypothetical protein
VTSKKKAFRFVVCIVKNGKRTSASSASAATQDWNETTENNNNKKKLANIPIHYWSEETRRECKQPIGDGDVVRAHKQQSCVGSRKTTSIGVVICEAFVAGKRAHWCVFPVTQRERCARRS